MPSSAAAKVGSTIAAPPHCHRHGSTPDDDGRSKRQCAFCPFCSANLDTLLPVLHWAQASCPRVAGFLATFVGAAPRIELAHAPQQARAPPRA
ncbi:hypothetical protein A8B73_02160 [Methylosinus sp. 3S-1]|nr:hypothetical protein A8B73_02160 [Methylosinus sp. 3S-1]